jgi:hypothetical protein
VKSHAAAAANRVMETPAADTHHQKDVADKTPDKCTNSDMAALITTVRQIVTVLQTADTKEDRFAVIMRAVYGLVI